MNWKLITDLPIGRQFVWVRGSHGESFPIVAWTDGTRFYPAFMNTPEKGAEPYEDDTFARWLPLAALVAVPAGAHAGLVEACEMAEIWFRGSVLSAQEQAVVATLRAALEGAKG